MYSFDKFEKQIVELDNYVKEDGLLIIHNTQYELMDTKVSELYETYGECGHNSALFGKDSKVISFEQFRKSVYRKK